ncbi:hypothetical protein EYF80_052232 [Liparis tanakae]|uniref:Uncharacterized protein n=1 Tax=Liparis tanakae TaxID=230148 RepID=A0A4Z2F9S6_9TELE|nr:hypothetical protein EYF80_052232 [Liparis tanakae]
MTTVFTDHEYTASDQQNPLKKKERLSVQRLHHYWKYKQYCTRQQRAEAVGRETKGTNSSVAEQKAAGHVTHLGALHPDRWRLRFLYECTTVSFQGRTRLVPRSNASRFKVERVSLQDRVVKLHRTATVKANTALTYGADATRRHDATTTRRPPPTTPQLRRRRT